MVPKRGIQIIVSRYAEDVGWLNRCFPQLDKLIYEKGIPESDDSISLPNVGFEAHTWFHHFAENYDSLYPITVCLQGDPFPHLGQAGAQLGIQILRLKESDFSFMSLGGGCMQRRDGRPDHPGLGSELTCLWKELMGYPPPERWHSVYGGMFAVHRDVVRKRPRSFYERGRDHVVTKEQACAAERAWGQIFA